MSVSSPASMNSDVPCAKTAVDSKNTSGGMEGSPNVRRVQDKWTGTRVLTERVVIECFGLSSYRGAGSSNLDASGELTASR